jgi:zinc transport system substrate-binding protein
VIGILARLAVAASLLAACQPAAPPDARPLVVASFYPLWELSRQVAGDRAEVVSLVPPGVEPHDWEPSPQDVARVQKARIFVYNGGGFEQSADRLLREIAGKGPLAVNTTADIDLVRSPSVGDEGHDRGLPVDPHVWLDPLLARRQVEAIRAALEKVDPSNRARYGENARALDAKLATLHDAFEAGLRDCPRRSLVVSHAAFTYLARRYRLTQIPVSGMAPESEPSPAQLAAIVRLAQREKVTHVFFEPLVSPKLAETLAREIGAQTLVLNPIEGLTREQAAAGTDYFGLMRENLKSLRAGLGCR